MTHRILMLHGINHDMFGRRDPAQYGTVTLVGANEPTALVPANVWQRTLPSETDALVTCLVSPGFDFDDFVLASRTELLEKYPEYSNLITELTYT